MSASSLAKSLLALVVALASLATIGFIGVKTGHITVIFGDHNKVDNSDHSTPAQPTKPIAAEVQREQPAAVQPTQSPLQPSVATADISQPSEAAHARRSQ